MAESQLFSADAIANFFLSTGMGKLTQLQIQKLVYLSHGWHLGLTDKPLIRDRIEAWKFGPVIRSLRVEFADFKAMPINRYAFEPGIVDDRLENTAPTVDSEHHDYAPAIKKLLGRVQVVYGGMSGAQLSTLTHKVGTPWYQVYNGQYGGNPPPGTHIPDELIRNHFKQLLAAPEKAS